MALIVLLAVLFGLFETSVSVFLPSPWSEIRPLLGIAILLVSLGKRNYAIIFGVVGGFVIDLFLMQDGLFAVGRMLVVVLLAALLSQTVLTNRSVYATTVLVIVARFIERLWVVVGNGLLVLLFHSSSHSLSLKSILYVMAWDIVFVSLLFLIIASFTKRLLMTGGKKDNRSKYA